MATIPTERDISEKAAERAALAAMQGSTAVKSGKLDDTIFELQSAATQILAHAQRATMAWITGFEAARKIQSDSNIANGLSFFETGNSLDVIFHALIEGGLLGAYKLSDPVPPKGEVPITLCLISKRLHDRPELRQRFVGEEWARDLGYQESMLAWAVQGNVERMTRFMTLVPPTWCEKSVTCLGSHDLLKLRNEARPLRLGHLAHHIPNLVTHLPTYDASGKLVDLTLDLATDLAFLLKGSAVSAQDYREFAQKQAANYWEATLDGPRQGYLLHQQKLEAVTKG